MNLLLAPAGRPNPSSSLTTKAYGKSANEQRGDSFSEFVQFQFLHIDDGDSEPGGGHVGIDETPHGFPFV